MSRKNTPLSSGLANKEEVINITFTVTVDEFTIHNCPGRWVLNLVAVSLLEEPLTNPLVDNHQGYLWLLYWEFVLKKFSKHSHFFAHH